MDAKALAALALRMMEAIQPNAPWKATYASTADAFGEVAHESPLFAGIFGDQQTVALFVSLAWFEGTFKPDAKGDNACDKKDDKGRCVGQPQSLCTFQIGRTHLASLGTTEEEISTDIKVCTKSARTLIASSIRICSKRPRSGWLGWYAAGGDGCNEKGLEKSAHRMAKADWLFAHYPPQP